MNINIIDNKDNSRKLAQIRELFEDDIEDYLALQEYVYNSLEDKNKYVRLSTTEIKNALDELRGVPLGIFVEEELLGAWIAISYKDTKDNLARDLHLPKEEHDKTITFDTAIIHPRLRGQKLNSIMAKHIMEYIKTKDFLYSVTTIEPQNFASLASMLGAGHMIVARKRKYGGLDRYILFSDLKSQILFDDNDIQTIDCNNIDKIEEYLSKGYAGTKLVFSPVGVSLVLNKIVQNQ